MLIVQHGEKVRAAGDPGLTEAGRSQAQQVADHLSPDTESAPQAVWASPLLRAQQTADPIAKAFNLTIQTDERLRERMNWADSERLSLEDFLDEWSCASRDRDYQPTVGDSSNDAARRFIDALLDIEQSAEDDATIVIVAHGGVTVDTLRTLLGDDELKEADPELIPNGVPCGAITLLTVANKIISVLALPDTGHLSETSLHRPA